MKAKGCIAQAGFTFIELMSVVAIVGILAALVMPSIKNYAARAKITEAIGALANCRTPVAEVFLSGSPGEPFPSVWGCESSTGTKYVDHVEVVDGVIKVETSAAMGDLRIAIKTITLAPMSRSGYPMTEDDQGDAVFRWRCGNLADGTSDTLDITFLPATCRGL